MTGRPRTNKRGRMSISVFLSTVSDEFRAYRDPLRSDLTRHNVAVKVQEDFKDLGARRTVVATKGTVIGRASPAIHGFACGQAWATLGPVRNQLL